MVFDSAASGAAGRNRYFLLDAVVRSLALSPRSLIARLFGVTFDNLCAFGRRAHPRFSGRAEWRAARAMLLRRVNPRNPLQRRFVLQRWRLSTSAIRVVPDGGSIDTRQDKVLQVPIRADLLLREICEKCC